MHKSACGSNCTVGLLGLHIYLYTIAADLVQPPRPQTNPQKLCTISIWIEWQVIYLHKKKNIGKKSHKDEGKILIKAGKPEFKLKHSTLVVRGGERGCCCASCRLLGFRKDVGTSYFRVLKTANGNVGFYKMLLVIGVAGMLPRREVIVFM